MKSPFQTKEASNEDPVIYADEPTKKQHGAAAKIALSILAPFLLVFRLLRKYTNLTVWIIIGMILGIVVGKVAPDFAVQLEPMGRVFIRMIQTVVGPLIFSTLVVGIAGHGDDLIRVGRLALKSIIYFEVATTFALIIGLLSVNIVKPGKGFSMDGLVAPATVNNTITWVTEMESIVPQSFFGAMADHSAVLAIVFCAVMFSVAIMRADAKSKKIMLDFNASLSAIMFKVVELIMNYAPIGIGCAIAATVGKYGLGALAAAGKLVGTLYGTLIVFVILVFLPVVLLCRLPLKDFTRAVGQPFLMAFATASSESALPKAMENMVAFGCPPEIVAFVIPTGYSFNLDGSTLYLALAAMFCAQVAGVSKSVGEQIVIMITLMLSSKGVAAVPRASFIVLTSTLSNANIPLAPLALIMGVDAFMDMARTSINVLGNMTACAVVSRWEGEFRNDAWHARQAGETPETLAMDEVESADYSTNHHHQLHSSGAEKESIRSVRSTSSAVEAYSGSSTQHRHQSTGDHIV
ncbi:Sodium:dicarboxylate symporter family-domain-containing protein [Dissophora ornata]|nr:Sodium:dicarboxylate symporter family-domain-containing protein [Dissophora ornata]